MDLVDELRHVSQPWFDFCSILIHIAQMKTESKIARKARYYAKKNLKYTTQPESGYTSEETYCETGQSRLNLLIRLISKTGGRLSIGENIFEP